MSYNKVIKSDKHQNKFEIICKSRDWLIDILTHLTQAIIKYNAYILGQTF